MKGSAVTVIITVVVATASAIQLPTARDRTLLRADRPFPTLEAVEVIERGELSGYGLTSTYQENVVLRPPSGANAPNCLP